MAITELHIARYRSIYDLTLPLGPVNVVVGPNGCGKTNLYRGLYLIAQAAVGQFARTLAEEGGMPSALWAGRPECGPVRMTLGFATPELAYQMQAGLPPDGPFPLDPAIKSEHVWLRQRSRRIVLLERRDMTVFARGDEGERITYPMTFDTSESVLGELREPHRYPELSVLRQEILGWRFYHGFRTDVHSPIRQEQPGTYTPVLAHDGRDLGAALATIREQGGWPLVEEALAEAFGGSKLELESGRRGMSVAMTTPGLARAFDARELSDGTLHYLCLIAALLTQRPPALMALNEPETSIHPDLIPALARLIVRAGERSQVWVTTHSVPLAEAIEEATGRGAIRLEKVGGATRVRQT